MINPATRALSQSRTKVLLAIVGLVLLGLGVLGMWLVTYRAPQTTDSRSQASVDGGKCVKIELGDPKGGQTFNSYEECSKSLTAIIGGYSCPTGSSAMSEGLCMCTGLDGKLTSFAPAANQALPSQCQRCLTLSQCNSAASDGTKPGDCVQNTYGCYQPKAGTIASQANLPQGTITCWFFDPGWNDAGCGVSFQRASVAQCVGEGGYVSQALCLQKHSATLSRCDQTCTKDKCVCPSDCSNDFVAKGQSCGCGPNQATEAACNKFGDQCVKNDVGCFEPIAEEIGEVGCWLKVPGVLGQSPDSCVEATATSIQTCTNPGGNQVGFLSKESCLGSIAAGYCSSPFGNISPGNTNSGCVKEGLATYSCEKKGGQNTLKVSLSSNVSCTPEPVGIQDGRCYCRSQDGTRQICTGQEDICCGRQPIYKTYTLTSSNCSEYRATHPEFREGYATKECARNLASDPPITDGMCATFGDYVCDGVSGTYEQDLENKCGVGTGENGSDPEAGLQPYQSYESTNQYPCRAYRNRDSKAVYVQVGGCDQRPSLWHTCQADGSFLRPDSLTEQKKIDEQCGAGAVKPDQSTSQPASAPNLANLPTSSSSEVVVGPATYKNDCRCRDAQGSLYTCKQQTLCCTKEFSGFFYNNPVCQQPVTPDQALQPGILQRAGTAINKIWCRLTKGPQCEAYTPTVTKTGSYVAPEVKTAEDSRRQQTTYL